MTTRIVKTLILAAMSAIAIAVWIRPHLGSDQATAHETAAIGGIPSRDHLEICVANLDGTPLKADLMSRIDVAFADVKNHKDFEKAGLNGGGGPRILAGCPSKATLNTDQWGRRRVASAGSIHTYVFVTSALNLKGASFKHYPRVVGHESICDDHTCNSVANAVYVTPEELADPKAMAQALTAGVGLELEQKPLYVDGVTADDKRGK